jgi:hypothetical protein
LRNVSGPGKRIKVDEAEWLLLERRREGVQICLKLVELCARMRAAESALGHANPLEEQK